MVDGIAGGAGGAGKDGIAGGAGGAGKHGIAIDVSSAIGEASAALGVVQCAGAARWLADRPGRRALISSGGCWGGRYASLTLRGVA
jgi:hypothetical protein